MALRNYRALPLLVMVGHDQTANCQVREGPGAAVKMLLSFHRDCLLPLLHFFPIYGSRGHVQMKLIAEVPAKMELRRGGPARGHWGLVHGKQCFRNIILVFRGP
jgi:hypothetical protein